MKKKRSYPKKKPIVAETITKINEIYDADQPIECK